VTTVASGLAKPYAVATAANGTIYLSNGNSLQRIDGTAAPVTVVDAGAELGPIAVSTSEPRGIDVDGDGSLYVVEATAKRIGHYTAAGTRLGDVGPVFADPYDVEVAADGTVYVVETAESGTIRRISPDGSVSTLSAG
jgi:streptogramin lyase